MPGHDPCHGEFTPRSAENPAYARCSVRIATSADCFASTNFNDLSLASNHTQGANVLLGDGSVRFLTQSTDLNILLAASTINGKEVVTLP